jgi:hypothetical protein
MLFSALGNKLLFMCLSSTFPPFALAFQTFLSTPFTFHVRLHPHYLNARWKQNVGLPPIPSYTLHCNYNNLYQILQSNGSAIIEPYVEATEKQSMLKMLFSRTRHFVSCLRSPISNPISSVRSRF